MECSKNTGLLAIWSDIENSYDTEFRQWHNCQHVTERVSIPGFVAGYRYCGLEGAPEYFMFYETQDSKVLGNEFYLNALNNPTAWTKKSLTYFRNAVRNIYSEIYAIGDRPKIVSPYIYLRRFGLPDENRDEIIKSFEKEYIEGVMEIPEVIRARLFETDREISGIGSDERKLHKAYPAEQPFLAVFEVLSLDVISGEKWNHVESMCPGLSELENVTKEKYWLDFMMNAPAEC